MENAAEAFKLILGVTIFGLALTVLFRMTSLARDTADQVFETIDTTIYQVAEEPENGANKVVSIEEIIPSLYRYVQEGYAVTIIDAQGSNVIGPDNIVAMFDSAIEGYVATCKWSANQYSGSSLNERENSNKRKVVIEKYINNNILNSDILKGYPTQKINEGSESANADFTAHLSLNSLIGRIYKNVDKDGNDNTQQPVYTDWQSGNRDRDSYITQRVNCDVYGGYGKNKYTLFNSRYSGGENETNAIMGGHKAVCGGAGLLATYKNNTFTEYIKVIDQNKYIEDSDLLKYGTIRYAKKREIIYVKN